MTPSSNLTITNVSLDILMRLAVMLAPSGESRDLNKSPFNVCTRQGPPGNDITSGKHVRAMNTPLNPTFI